MCRDLTDPAERVTLSAWLVILGRQTEACLSRLKELGLWFPTGSILQGGVVDPLLYGKKPSPDYALRPEGRVAGDDGERSGEKRRRPGRHASGSCGGKDRAGWADKKTALYPEMEEGRKAEHQLRDPQGPFPPDFSSGRHAPESGPYLRRSHPSLLACRNASAICAGVWSVTKVGSGPDARFGTLKKPYFSSSHQAVPSSRQGSMRTAGQPICSGMKNTRLCPPSGVHLLPLFLVR